jgi:hypothetical protein
VARRVSLRFGDAYDLPVTVSLHGHADESTGSVELRP